MKLFAKIVFVVSIFFVPCISMAATYYIRADSNGNGSGTDWNNAFTDLPSTLIRGDTYYVADGAYSGHSLNTPITGDQWITILKATSVDHGTGIGWNNSYGDSYAEFNGTLHISTGYWKIDGQVGYWKGDREQYGFRINCDSNNGISVGNVAVNNLIFEHLYFWRTNQDNNPGPRAFDFTSTVPGSSNVQIRYCYLYKITTPFYFGVPANPGTPYWSNVLVEFSVVQINHSSSSVHSELSSTRNCDDITFRYNWFEDLEGTGGINAMNGNFQNWQIYGNIFTGTGLNTCQGYSHGIMSDRDRVTGGLTSNFQIYNNTITVRAGQAGILFLRGLESGMPNILRNNLWYGTNSVGLSGINVSSHNYYGAETYCINGRYDSSRGVLSGVNGSPCASVGNSPADEWAQKTNENPFVNSGQLNFALIEPTDSGFNLPAPFNEDCSDKLFNGPTGNCVNRGLDGVWDRGAFEFNDEGDDNSPPESIQNLRISK